MDRKEIEKECKRLGYSAGWRFITCPERNLRAASIALVTLNPGGSRQHGPDWSTEEGSAYVVEAWGGQYRGADPLQVQVQSMCKLLGTNPGEIFSAHFVPFRSPNWDSLARRDEAVVFARRLWSWVLKQSSARLYICLGKTVAATEIANLLGASLTDRIRAGWGGQTIDRYVAPTGQMVIGLPHLGRFKLFGNRPVSEAAFLKAIGQEDSPRPKAQGPVIAVQEVTAVASTPEAARAQNKSMPKDDDWQYALKKLFVTKKAPSRVRGDSTGVHARICDVVAGHPGITGSALLDKLELMNWEEHPTHHTQPGSRTSLRKWLRGWVGGCLRASRGFIVEKA